MMEWMPVISDGAAGCVRVVLCLYLIGALLPARRIEREVCFVGVLGAVIVEIVVVLSEMPLLYHVVLEIAWAVICAVRFLKAELRMSLFIAAFYEEVLFLWCFLLQAAAGILAGKTVMPEQTGVIAQAAFWLAHLIFIALMAYSLRRNAFAGLQAAALMGFLAVMALSQQTGLAIPPDTLGMWLILSVILLMAALVFRLRRQYEVERELVRLKSEQTELLTRDYTELNRVYAANAKLFHDFHNHIGVLRQLIEHQKYSEALSYLNELQAPIREMVVRAWTKDETVDYLINSKMMAALEAGIAFGAQVEFPCGTNIASADMCAILGNLLDNAIEAAGQVAEQERRKISLTIRRINQMLIIKVENSCSGRTVVQDGTLKTTKTDGGLHGWGLRSAQTAAEKYDGMVQTSCENGCFRAVVTLSYQGVAQPGTAYKV